MSDEDAFLAAIRENPADDTLRLVYADWLDEQGHPDRAAFLRLEAQLAGRGPEAVVYSADLLRLNDLRSALNAAWVDAAGRRYNVVLRSCTPGRGAEVAAKIVVFSPGLRDLRNRVSPYQARRMVCATPTVVFADVPFTRAAEAREYLRRGGVFTHIRLPRGRGDAVADAVVSPTHSPPRLPRVITSREVAVTAIRAEAARLGLTLDAFLRPENRGNRVLRRALAWFDDREPLRAGRRRTRGVA